MQSCSCSALAGAWPCWQKRNEVHGVELKFDKPCLKRAAWQGMFTSNPAALMLKSEDHYTHFVYAIFCQQDTILK